MVCVPGCQICLRLRRSALTIVGEAGLEGSSLDAIASHANLTVVEARRHYADAATCIYETYDAVSASIALDMAGAFGQGTSWDTGLALARQRLLNRMARRPAEARLCFVEVLRGDRRLRLRREQTRQWIVDFLTDQYEQRRTDEGLPEMQIEMLIGAGFQALSSAVSAAEDSATLERSLTELAELLAPVGNPAQ